MFSIDLSVPYIHLILTQVHFRPECPPLFVQRNNYCYPKLKFDVHEFSIGAGKNGFADMICIRTLILTGAYKITT